MKKIISMIWAIMTGAVILVVANNTAIANMTNMTSQAAGNISGCCN
jgi:hypothetical protein